MSTPTAGTRRRRISLPVLRGYVLEEVLARLLFDNGYRLLVSEQQDPDALTRGPHGLLVRGRGTDHQADVLGELMLPTPFSLPLRIFVEAKYRASVGSLRDVRNAHGVLHDVNEYYATGGRHVVPLRRHHYRYTLFSTSGFSVHAQRYALAQQISLVDLSSPAFAPIKAAVSTAAEEIYRLDDERSVSQFPIGQVRTALRLALGTWTDEGEVPSETRSDPVAAQRRAERAVGRNPALQERNRLPVEGLADIVGGLAGRTRDDLILGFPAASFVLALHAEDPTALSAYVARHGSDIRVDIRFAERRNVTGDWVIVPADGSDAFRLRFALPSLLEDWLLGEDGAAALRAREVKADLLSSVAVFQQGRLVRLQFEPPRRHRG
jgi:hypothetical protein